MKNPNNAFTYKSLLQLKFLHIYLKIQPISIHELVSQHPTIIDKGGFIYIKGLGMNLKYELNVSIRRQISCLK